ncbi:MAG TPA: hypothetical protein VKN18_15535 [Blastocatellia bacterium]|nr:hypothetical protein [Blastocatellia bacterium]
MKQARAAGDTEQRVKKFAACKEVRSVLSLLEGRLAKIRIIMVSLSPARGLEQLA